MKVNQLKRFLMTCTPTCDVGITVMTKEGPQFWTFDGVNGFSIFKAPDGHKCISLLESRKNDAYPYGAEIHGMEAVFDDIPLSPDSILAELKARFDITPKIKDKKIDELTDDELTDIMFETIHKEIGDLIRLNNDLLVYVKNKFKKQKKYWIEVKPKDEIQA